MNRFLFYDNGSVPSDEIRQLLGVQRFADVRYRRRTLAQRIADISQKAELKLLPLEGQRDRLALEKNLDASITVLWVSSATAFGCSDEDAALFLKKLSMSRTSLLVDSNGHRQIAVLVGDLARQYLRSVDGPEGSQDFLQEIGQEFNRVPSDVTLFDLRDQRQFTDYLTSNFDVRFFNAVDPVNDFVVEKKSSDHDKLRNEFTYYGLLPDEMKAFFVQPYDFQTTGTNSRYKMERLYIPDMAIQWIHGAFDEMGFERFLTKVFYFLSIRRQQKVTAEQAREVHLDTYRSKVQRRLQQMRSDPNYPAIDAYARAGLRPIDGILSRYLSLLDQQAAAPVSAQLCIGHGDLCFSNIIYEKSTGLMRFIDPKGAATEKELYLAPSYDVAKLAHSILGSYDFINYGLFRIEINADLKLELILDTAPHPWAAALFNRKLVEYGYQPRIIRLFEVSLFLSMLPMHTDQPKKVLAFLMRADQILDEIESQK
ncbi:MAG TPA: hypothetical protein VE954_16420 [Oligoflexus sp.]|uniref:hypothetical protein n=1 Tax=Oligoflexus sp. TaxID=1971216 RepID=UPI002D5CE9F3|nr:hypothetical protein [Oligoflexus sp.]HYX34684.1 hypothetical protein [Oligoflexus sp.]